MKLFNARTNCRVKCLLWEWYKDTCVYQCVWARSLKSPIWHCWLEASKFTIHEVQKPLTQCLSPSLYFRDVLRCEAWCNECSVFHELGCWQQCVLCEFRVCVNAPPWQFVSKIFESFARLCVDSKSPYYCHFFFLFALRSRPQFSILKYSNFFIFLLELFFFIMFLPSILICYKFSSSYSASLYLHSYSKSCLPFPINFLYSFNFLLFTAKFLGSFFLPYYFLVYFLLNDPCKWAL